MADRIALLALGGCATPGILKKPLGAPTMARPSQADPLPVYAAPDPEPPAPVPGEPSDPA
ncbi:MAG: hypothetical protein ACR2FH_01840 [Caulobacteraceae bacterium]